ncbi:TonB family protein [Alteromonas sp. H39]|uniref:TonB family protein n=1 Tax=Alteromonas sp. H39 TaxID=3389876 RepID=UPI0039DFB8AB
MKPVKWFATTACVLILSACAGTPQLTQKPVEIPVHEIAKYWLPEVSGFSYGSAPRQPGTVIVRYLVDSEGDIYDVEIVKSTPEGLWDGVVRKSLRNTTFTPSPLNKARVPVKVTAQYDFSG